MSDNFYHESAHSVIAKIFEDIFKTNFVTLNEEYCKQYDPQAAGGISGKPIKKPFDLNIEDHDAIIFIFIAGYCMDGIMNHDELLPQTFFKMENWGPQFATLKYSGDAYYISLHFNAIEGFKNDIVWKDYISSTIKCVSEILQDPIVLQAVRAVREALLSSSNNTLTFENLQVVFDQTDLQQYITEQLPALLEIRKRMLS